MIAVLFLNIMSTKRYSLRKSRQNLKKGQDVKYCRTCLSSQDLVPIFPNEHMQLKRTEDLKLVTGLEIKCNDGLSQMICTKCIERMNIALQFRSESRKAEKALLGLALGTKIKKKCDSEASVVNKPKIQKCNPYEVKIENFSYQDKNVPIVDYNFDSVSDNGADDWQNDEVHVKVENDDYDDFAEKSEDVEPKIKQTDNFDSVSDNGADDWQNDEIHVKVENDDYDDFAEKSEDVEPKIKQYSKKPLPKLPARKRLSIPNATNYKCNICSKEFRMKGTYRAHLKSHTNYFACESCGKHCRDNNQLQDHKRARHGLGRKHKCIYCEYSSATKEALTIHQRTHTGEKPYICDHCGSSFHRRANLVQHIAIHLPEKNVQCSICSKFEKSRKLLQVHISKVHREKRYKYLCPVCQDVFARPYNVRLHLTRTHGVSKANQTSVIHRIETPKL